MEARTEKKSIRSRTCCIGTSDLKIVEVMVLIDLMRFDVRRGLSTRSSRSTDAPPPVTMIWSRMPVNTTRKS